MPRRLGAIGQEGECKGKSEERRGQFRQPDALPTVGRVEGGGGRSPGSWMEATAMSGLENVGRGAKLGAWRGCRRPVPVDVTCGVPMHTRQEDGQDRAAELAGGRAWGTR